MKITPTKILHYGLLLIAAYIVYSWFVKGGGKDAYENHPRNKDKFKDAEDDVKVQGQGHRYADDVRHIGGDDSEPVGKREGHAKVKKPPPGPPETKRKHVTMSDKDLQKEEEAKSDFKRMKASDRENIRKIVEDPDDNAAMFEEEVEEHHKERVKEEQEEFQQVKMKKREEDGEDMLKEFNDADLNRDPEVQKHIDRLSDHENIKIPQMKKAFDEDHDDMETAAEKTRRRKLFFEKIQAFDSPEELHEDKHIHESRDDFTFVTAARTATYKATLTFIHSVQLNFAKSPIGIIDIGLSSEEIDYMKTLCNVEVIENYLPLFPAFLTNNMAMKLWRPIVLQVALGKFGHFVYVDPGRYFKRGAELKGYYALSRKGGAAIFGNVKGYATPVLTHPEMYYYLAINVRKLLRLQHVEINMMILHNSEHLRHFFTRWLHQCTMEEYCIAPPGAQRKCNHNLYPKSKKYAECHRYDESAINILLASWHNYDWDHYAHEDFVTRTFDGRDATPFLKFCKKKKHTREL